MVIQQHALYLTLSESHNFDQDMLQCLVIVSLGVSRSVSHITIIRPYTAFLSPISKVLGRHHGVKIIHLAIPLITLTTRHVEKVGLLRTSFELIFRGMAYGTYLLQVGWADPHFPIGVRKLSF